MYFWKAWQPPIKGLIVNRDISICWNSLQVLITQSGLWVLCSVILMCVICHYGMSRRQFVCWTHVSIIKVHYTTVIRIWERWNVPYICNPPRVHTATTRRSGSRTRDSGAGGGRSNKERQRLQPLASVARAPLFEVRRVRFYTQPLLAYIRYTHPPKPHSHPGHGTNVTPPGPHCHNSSERVSNPGFRCGRRAL